MGTIFRNHYKPGKTQCEFSRDEFVEIARFAQDRAPKEPGGRRQVSLQACEAGEHRSKTEHDGDQDSGRDARNHRRVRH
jgi:hypothetical protein